uniref:Uncharacterized protein n=1 Tax=Anguilla anguilla TaxID=7936 RepID=A0A0E9WL04_ANGAN
MLMSDTLHYAMFIVMHHQAKANSLYVKTYLAINLFLILINHYT